MKKEKYILTLDAGTTGARAIIFDFCGKVTASAQHELTQIYPEPGFVEHNPTEIFSSQYSAAAEAIINAGIKPEDIAAVGITNQRETTVVWDAETGEPVYNAIVWQCRRTASACRRLTENGKAELIAEKTGLRPDAYFSATKLQWILKNVPGAAERANKGELLFGTVDTWLLWKLTNGRVHATDYTNASRTMLFNIRTLEWDSGLLELFGIPEKMLPQVFPSGHIFGEAEIMGAQIPVCSIVGDQQAALFGQRCFEPGSLKNTYGTGCFLLMNTGENAVKSKNGLLTTLAACVEGERPDYALEGSVFIGGAVIQWLRDGIRIIDNAAQSEELAKSVENSLGVYIVPAFSGLGAPYWNPYAAGTIVGLTRGSSREHIVRAALESIAYQTDDLIRAMRADSLIDIIGLKADGGASANGFLMQFQADISGTQVIRPDNIEATAAGAAYLAGITAGVWKSRSELPENTSFAVFRPQINDGQRQSMLNNWRNAVAAAEKYADK